MFAGDEGISTGSRDLSTSFAEASARYETLPQKQTPRSSLPLAEFWQAKRKELRRTGLLIPKAAEVFCGDVHADRVRAYSRNSDSQALKYSEQPLRSP